MKKRDKYIYAFTRDYITSRVKIGSAKNWKQRLWRANHSEWNCGETWHCLAILDMASCQEDRTFHTWLSRKHPEINTTKIQEFFELTPSMVFGLFEEYAKDHGPNGRSIRMNPCDDPCFDERTFRFKPHKDVKYAIPESSLNHDWKKAEKVSFDQRKIPVGAILDYIPDLSKKCVVSGRRTVTFNGKKYKSLTDLTQALTGKRASGTAFWKYKGTTVREIR